jgi:hypothetical protein
MNEMLVKSITLTGDKRYIFYEVLPSSSSNQSTGLRLESISASDLSVEQPHSVARDWTILAGQIKRLVGTYQDHIVFLDYDYWLCTWKINADVSTLQRHFFLPRDWINQGTLPMAVLDAQGAFLCPKHGSVAIVRNGVKF